MKEKMCTLVQDEPGIGQVIEDNILALLDTVGVKDADDIEDDKMSYIEAVYALCISAKEPKAPTWKMHEGIFQILDGNCSMVLNSASYLLLVEIEQRFPRIAVRETSGHISHGVTTELVFDFKIWSPFCASSVPYEKNKSGIPTRKVDLRACEYMVISDLLEVIRSKVVGKPWDPSIGVATLDDPEMADHKIMGLILKFRYFFGILEHDFKCRLQVFKGKRQKTDIISSSHLIKLFKEAKKKPLVECLLHLIAATSVCTNHAKEALELNEFGSCIQSLLEMAISVELDLGKTVNASPRKPKQDVQRSNSILDIINEIVGYDKRMFAHFLQAMADSDCKLRIILNYFIKNAPKPLVMEMNVNPDRITILDILKCFKEPAAARNIYNCIHTDILQVLLATAFKAGLRQEISNGIDARILEMCELLKTAFENLQTISSDLEELHPAAKQALISAEALIAFAK